MKNDKNDELRCGEDLPMVMTVDEVSKLLRVGKNTTYALIHSGKLKSILVGRQIRVSRSVLNEYLKMSDSVD